MWPLTALYASVGIRWHAERRRRGKFSGVAQRLGGLPEMSELTRVKRPLPLCRLLSLRLPLKHPLVFSISRHGVRKENAHAAWLLGQY